jgi:hypothetical protein
MEQENSQFGCGNARATHTMLQVRFISTFALAGQDNNQGAWCFYSREVGDWLSIAHHNLSLPHPTPTIMQKLLAVHSHPAELACFVQWIAMLTTS